MATILVIEDESMLAEMYNTMLTQAGHTVEVAVNGKEGIAKAESNPPNLIFLDMMMPQMNGLEVLDYLKATPDTADIPIVILSNFADERYIKAALDKGAKRYIVKSDISPSSFAEIATTILEEQIA